MVFDQDQLNNINTVLQRCKANNAPELAIQAICCAAFGESHWHTHDLNGLGCDGIFQCCPPPIGGAEAYAHRFDVAWVADKWLLDGFYKYGGGIELAKRGLAPGDIANRVEGAYSNLQTGANYYGQYLSQAKWVIGVYGPRAFLGYKPAPVTEQVTQPSQASQLGSNYNPNTLHSLFGALDWSGDVDKSFTLLASGCEKGSRSTDSMLKRVTSLKFLQKSKR